jgi:hypothetical protein
MIDSKKIKEELYKYFPRKYFTFSVKVFDNTIVKVELKKAPVEYFHYRDAWLYKNFTITRTQHNAICEIITNIIEETIPLEQCGLGYSNYSTVIHFGKRHKGYDFVDYKQSVDTWEEARDIIGQINKKRSIMRKLKG